MQSHEPSKAESFLCRRERQNNKTKQKKSRRFQAMQGFDSPSLALYVEDAGREGIWVTSRWQPARYRRPQACNHKEADSAKDLNKPGGQLFLPLRGKHFSTNTLISAHETQRRAQPSPPEHLTYKTKVTNECCVSRSVCAWCLSIENECSWP